MVFCKKTVPESRQNKCNNIYNKNSSQYPLNIGYNAKYIEEAVNSKFLDLETDNRFNWKTNVDQLVPKLS
jgi:hypothetical protein